MSESTKAMDLAHEAGSILLENGAEISRVEDTILNIAGHYHLHDVGIYVLSNGIMATSHEYARSKFIPIQGTRLDKVVEINQLSREVTQGSCQLEQLEQRLQQIRTLPPKPALEQIFVSALGSAAFCIIFD
jgi:uncharacterized membrane protein YjjP (DUF1212 family)